METTHVSFKDGLAVRGTFPDPDVLKLIVEAAGPLPLVIADPPRFQYRRRECSVCKGGYQPTTSRQKRCAQCGPSFSKKQEAAYKVRQREIRPECRLVEAAKSTAKTRGLPFDLTSDYVRSIWNEECPILGIKLVRGASVRSDNSPSLDRIIPAKGYVIGNVHVISWRANRIKNDATVEELEQIAAYLRRVGAA